MNIVSTTYKYFIAYHPIVVLCCYIFAYFLLSTYIFNLGKVLMDMNEVIKEETKTITTDWWMQDKPAPETTRRNTQTQKTTPHIYQKGRHKLNVQEVRRGEQLT